MAALFFGESERPLYGYYHEADFSADRRVGLLICNGLGHEYLRTHRMLKHLSTQLARAGIGVLRFDYPGTGDSWGDTSDITIDNWAASITMAMEELEARSAADRLAMLSLRAGALVCHKASLQAFNVCRHFCLDPVLDGNRYCRELVDAQAAMLLDHMRFREPRQYRNPNNLEWLGHEYSTAFTQQLQNLRIDTAQIDDRHHVIQTRPFEILSGVPIKSRLDTDCRWKDAAALEMQVVLPGLSTIITESL